VVLVILAIIWILPILWAIDTSLKPEGETTAVPVSWFASHFTLDAYITTFATTNLPRWYFNSFLTSAIISIVTVILASMAAFAFSRVPFKGRSILFWIILAGIMVPIQILIVPLFTQMQSLGLVDTYWGIMLPQFASPIAVFIFKQYFDGIPRELEEAAIMDGASRWRVYWQIWMPLARPAIAAVAIFAFVISWNNFLWPFIVISGNNMMTVPVGLSTVQTSFGVRYAQIMASAVLGGIPVLIVFLFFQRQIVQGIAGTGLKG
jgi:multiple sugar transport system permease protein